MPRKLVINIPDEIQGPVSLVHVFAAAPAMWPIIVDLSRLRHDDDPSLLIGKANTILDYVLAAGFEC